MACFYWRRLDSHGYIIRGIRFLFTSDTCCVYPMSVSSFLRLLLVFLRGDDILQLSSIRVVTAVSCRMWSRLFIRRSLVYFSPFRIKIRFKLIGQYCTFTREGTLWVVLSRQGDLLLVHYICVFIGQFYVIADFDWSRILDFWSVFVVMVVACEQTLTWFFIRLLFLDDSLFSAIRDMFRLMFVYHWNGHISFDMEK